MHRKVIMRNEMKLEIRKALCNKLFLISILIGCTIAMVSFKYNIKVYQDFTKSIEWVRSLSDETIDPCTGMFSLFNHWMGGEPFSSGSMVFFFVFPLLVAIPYGWSYCEEKKTGYVRNIIVKTGKTKYFVAKYTAVFLSGGLAFIIPLIFNLGITALFIPAIKPDIIYDTGTGVFFNSFMSYLYYTVPFIYIFLYTCIDFIFGGLIACLSFAFTSFIKQKVVVVLVPFALVFLWHYSLQFIYVSKVKSYYELSPMYFLRAVETRYSASGIVILLQALVLLIITLVISLIWERKHEIY